MSTQANRIWSIATALAASCIVAGCSKPVPPVATPPVTNTSPVPNDPRPVNSPPAGGNLIVAVPATDAAPAEIIDQPGTYRSPSGARQVTISVPAPNQLRIYAGEPAADAPAPPANLGLTVPHVSGAPWFMAWDAKDQLWYYLDNRGIAREYSISKPVIEQRQEGPVTRMVTERRVQSGYDDWDGMPKAFYDRLPQAEKAKYRPPGTEAAIQTGPSPQPAAPSPMPAGNSPMPMSPQPSPPEVPVGSP